MVSLGTDDFGNIIVYLNENVRDIGYYPGRYRKGGKKFFISVDTIHHTAREYIDELVRNIDRKKNSPRMVELFELLIRDPRFEKRFNYLLINMPKAKDREYYEKMKEELDREYQKKLDDLQSSLAYSNLISELSEQYQGLVPKAVLDAKAKKM